MVNSNTINKSAEEMFNQLKVELDGARAMYQFILSIIDETNIQMETASEETKELLKFRLNWLETQLTSLRETYGRK